MKNNETTNRYLAGYVDGNGTITVLLNKRNHCQGCKPQLFVCIDGCIEEWKNLEKMFLEMYDHYGFGSIQRRILPSGKTMIRWSIFGEQAESLLNRIKKHLVIKGQHAERLIKLWKRYRGYGNYVRNPRWLKKYITASRQNTGPLKPKQFVSKPWMAGYVDSDGYLSTTENNMCLDFSTAESDRAALDLISATYGREIKEGRNNEIRLRHYFPKKNQTTAKRILVPLLPHLRLKKWHSEQILASYNNAHRD